MAIMEILCDSKKTQDYINNYPAFLNTNGYFINNGFYHAWYDANAEFLGTYYNFPRVDIVNEAKKRLREYLDTRVHMSLNEFETYVLPVILATCSNDRPQDYHSINMKKAESFLRYIEPAWCDYKGIESTGYLPVNELERAAELLADDEFEDI